MCGPGREVALKRKNEALFKFVIDAFSAGLGAVTATGMTHPIDTIKTRVQTSGVGTAAVKQALDLSRPLTLLSGVRPVLIGTAIASSMKFGCYQSLTRALIPYFSVLHPSFLRAACATACSVLSSILYVPWEGVKQRMQTNTVASRSIRHAFITTFREGGIKAIYRGWLATLLRDIPFTVIELVIYDGLKTQYRHRIKGKELRTLESLSLGGLSGALAGAITCPVDVIKTRLMTGVAVQGDFRADVQYLFRKEGLPVFFRGVGARVAIIAPMTAIFFAVFETSRVALRRSLALPPDVLTAH
eukprot:Plantae.Rhodophyta-Purpureofilum_apyrenoidigerum.ctg3589.p1 GENE.Plantae.Rhodophyta-Purpureofilum_apyrenoidigerum.ctg3589~~Plantae.Rhodophyta-Purpureofilum_apyrenoidigerum.ctg3589.p1  ORF type:complete len:301 (-),score=21.63 Plantae.Rhodophyta-Purpureofilum_apyrenoidigerum.ctg3589:9-911(-)